MSDDKSALASISEQLRGVAEVVSVASPVRALARLDRQPEEFDALYVASAHFQDAFHLGRLLQNERILDGMPDGVAMLDVDTSILWANSKYRQWCQKDDVGGQGFYQALGNPEILGPDFCPFHTALATGQPSISTLRSGDQYFQTHAAPVDEPDGESQYLIVTVRDVSAEMLQQQKLAAIHKAGIELADLTPDEVFDIVTVAAIFARSWTHPAHLGGKRIGIGSALKSILLPADIGRWFFYTANNL